MTGTEFQIRRGTWNRVYHLAFGEETVCGKAHSGETVACDLSVETFVDHFRAGTSPFLKFCRLCRTRQRGWEDFRRDP